MAFYIEDYENTHISMRGTLWFLQSASDVEVSAESDRLMDEERAATKTDTQGYQTESVDFDLQVRPSIRIRRLRNNRPEPTDEELRAAKLTHIRAERRAYESILDKFEGSPTLEGSWIICWQPLTVAERLARYGMEGYEKDAVRENQKSYFRHLSKVLEQTKAKISGEPDGYILDRDAAIFIQLSVGLILLAKQNEGGHSERQWEWLDDALRVINMPKTESITPFYEKAKYPRIALLSTKMAESLIWSMLAHREFAQGEHESSLMFYRKAVESFEEINRNILGWVYEGEPPDDWLNDDSFEDVLEDESGAMGYQIRLSFDIFRLSRAVEAFDALIDENSRDTNWPQVAEHCRFFAKNWYLLSIPVESKHIPEQETVSESWAIAHGIVLNRMSNDDRIKELHRDRDYQIEDRLRLYFFGDAWDKLPDKARAALISADREYENARGRRPIIFDHLRHAARAIMVESLWKPYREFLHRRAADGLKDLSDLQQVRQIIEDDQTEPDLAPLVRSPYFDEFLGTISEDTKFVRRLPEKLLGLNDWANKVSHEHHWGYKGFEGQIRETYAEFLGIERNGILPRLMRLHPKVKAQRTTRR